MSPQMGTGMQRLSMILQDMKFLIVVTTCIFSFFMLHSDVKAQTGSDAPTGIKSCRPSSSPGMNSANEYLTFKGHALTIKYPCDWIVIDPSQRPGFPPNFVVGLISPRTETLDSYSENVIISTSHVTLSSAGLADVAAKQIANLKRVTNNLQVVSSTHTTLPQGNAAQVVTFTSTEPTGDLVKNKGVFTRYGNLVYFLNFSGELNAFDYYYPIFNKMLGTLKFFDINQLDTNVGQPMLPGYATNQTFQYP